MKSPAVKQSDKVVEIALGGVQSALDGQDVLLKSTKDVRRASSSPGPKPSQIPFHSRRRTSLVTKYLSFPIHVVGHPYSPQPQGNVGQLLSPIHTAESVCWTGPFDTW